jgi:hypothetical protein
MEEFVIIFPIARIPASEIASYYEYRGKGKITSVLTAAFKLKSRTSSRTSMFKIEADGS